MALPSWIHPTGEGTNDPSFYCEPNYTGSARTYTIQGKQAESNLIVNMVISQDIPQYEFNIYGSNYYSEYNYTTVLNKTIPVTSYVISTSATVDWTIDNQGSIPSWLSISKSGTDIVYSISTITSSLRSFDVILKQNGSGNTISLNINQNKATVGLHVATYNGTVFIAAYDGVYKKDVDNVFKKTNLNYYTYGQLHVVNNILYAVSYYAYLSWSGSSWTTNTGSRDPLIIYRWNTGTSTFVPVNDIQDIPFSMATASYYGALVGRVYSLNNKYLITAWRTSSFSSTVNAVDTSTPSKLYMQDEIGLGVASCLNCYEQSDPTHFIGDFGSVLRLCDISLKYSTNFINFPTIGGYTFTWLIKYGDWYYAGYVSTISTLTNTGTILKFKINGEVVTDSSRIDISSTTGDLYTQGTMAPNQGAAIFNNKLYIPLNNALYACAVLNLADDTYKLVPNKSASSFYSYAWVSILNNRVYLMSQIVSNGSTGSTINEGIIEIIQDGSSYKQQPTNVVKGLYGRTHYNSNEIYIPGNGLSLNYDNGLFKYVLYE